MKKLLAFILLTTFLFLTSCGDDNDPMDEGMSEKTEALEKEIGYYTHYLVECNAFFENRLPKMIGNNEEFLKFIGEYVTNECAKKELISKISAETFDDYFVMVIYDSSITYHHTETLIERTYKDFRVVDDTIVFCVSSIYPASKHEDYIKTEKSDFILIPREFYNEDLQDKTIKIYNEIYIESDDLLNVKCIQVTKNNETISNMLPKKD